MTRLRFLLPMIVLLAACTNEGSPVVGGTSATTATTATIASTTTTAPLKIVLEPTGLGVVAFGAAKDTVVSILTSVLGPVDSTGQGCPLLGPNTTTARWKELSVQFADGKFDSYGVMPLPGATPALNLMTRAGIGLNSTVAQLKAAYGPNLKFNALGYAVNDFAVTFAGVQAPLRGDVTATSDDGRVRAFFTQTCD